MPSPAAAAWSRDAGPLAMDGGGAAGDAVRGVIGSGAGRPLDAATRAFFEARFGAPMDGVRVHTGAAADASARAVDALAYTVGRHVVFRDGQFAPGSTAGRRLLAHELAHTLQQEQAGGASPQPFTIVRPDDPSERQADAAADAVLSGGGVPALTAAAPAVARQNPPPVPGDPPAPAPDASAVGASVDLVLDRLEGYTSRWDSEDILNEFRNHDAGYDRAMLDELQRRGSGNIAWMFEDMTEEDGRTLRALLIERHAAANLLGLVADDVVDRLRGWTSEDDSHAIVADFAGLGGTEVDQLLVQVEGKAGMDAESLRAWLFGDLDRVSGYRLAELFYAAGAPRATSYAAGWTVDRVYSLLSGYTSHNDSTTILSALRQVPAPLRSYVQYRLDEKCRAERSQSAEDSLMEDMDTGDYAALRAEDGYTLRPYDRQPSWLESAAETIVSGLDYAFVVVQWIACGVAGIVTGILSVVWDLVVLVRDIVVGVYDLLGSLVYLLSGGAAGSAEWLAVKDFFRGIGHLFTNPGQVFDQMWEELRLEFNTIEGPLTQCRRAEFIVRKFINALVNIILIFVAGYGAVKTLARGVQGVAEFSALVREVGFTRAVAQVGGEAAEGVRGAVRVTATRLGELSTALRAPSQLLTRVRGSISAVLMAAEEEGYWRYLRRQAGTAARGTAEEEGRFWRERRDYWRTRGQAQQAREADLSRRVGDIDAGLQRQEASADADRLISAADDEARALDREVGELHDDVTGRRQPPPEPTATTEPPAATEPPAGETPAPRREGEPTTERRGTGEGEGERRTAPRAPEEDGVTARETTPDGQHEVRVRNRGLERCSFDCPTCRATHRDLLSERADLEQRLQRLETLAAGTPGQQAQAAREGALFDQRARDITALRGLDDAALAERARTAAAGTVEANEIAYETARRARPGLTYAQWARDHLAATAGEALTAELERTLGAGFAPAVVDDLGTATLANLTAGGLTPADIAALLRDHPARVLRWAADGLPAADVRTLLTRLRPAAAEGLMDVGSAEAQRLVNLFGDDVVNTVSPQVNGTNLKELADSFGASARGIAQDRIASRNVKTKQPLIGDLNTYAERLRGARDPAGTAELASIPPMGPSSIVTDSNYQRYLNYALQKIAGGTDVAALPPLERRVFQDWVARGRPGAADLRVAPATVAETGGLPNVSRSGIPLTVDRGGAEYTTFLTRLEGANVGGAGAGGAADRLIVADTLFAVNPGGTVTFVTTDRVLYNNLATIADPPINVGRLAGGVPPRNVPSVYGTTGFLVRGPGGRTLRVIPIGEPP